MGIDKNKIAEKIFEVVVTLIIFMLIVLIFFGCSSITANSDCSLDLEDPTEYIEDSLIISDTFTENNFRNYLKQMNIKFPDTIFAQARLETGNFKSKCFIERNNLFGFRKKTGYMIFKDWKESVEYYAHWQDKYYKGGDYFEFLTRIGYAEADSVYKERILKCIK